MYNSKKETLRKIVKKDIKIRKIVKKKTLKKHLPGGGGGFGLNPPFMFFFYLQN